MLDFIQTKQSHADNSTSAMGAETIKTRVSPKNQKSRGNILRMALTMTMMLFVFTSFAQFYVLQSYRFAPKENERVVGTVTGTISKTSNNSYNSPYMDYEESYSMLLEKAEKKFPNKVIDLRNVNYSRTHNDIQSPEYEIDSKGRKTDVMISAGSQTYTWSCSATVIEFVSSETNLDEPLVKAIDKALSNVREGSRLAIDQISVSGGDLDKGAVKDQLIDVLLDKSYKVVAKEYLEKLKEEQEQQQGGGYNERTTARTDNLSGVGYFLNVKVTEKSIRVQVVNVSTGEYEGNATVDF